MASSTPSRPSPPAEWQLRHLLRGLPPGGAIRLHRLHAARGDDVRPLRAARPGRPRALFADSQIRAFLAIYAASPSGSSSRGCSSATWSTRRRCANGLQPRIDHQHDRLHLDRLLAVGTAGRGAVLLRDDDLRLLRAPPRAGRRSSATSCSSARFPARSGACMRRTSCFIPRFQGAPVPEDVLNSVMAFFMMFFLTLAVGAIALVLLGLDPVSAISGAAASPLEHRPRARPDHRPGRELRAACPMPRNGSARS